MKVAMCHVDVDEPLVSTFAFAKYEFICMACGRLYGWVEPLPAEPTPELEALADQRKAEWQALEDGLIVARSWLKDCAQCKSGPYHSEHATPQEIEADRAARARIAERFPRHADWLTA